MTLQDLWVTILKQSACFQAINYWSKSGCTCKVHFKPFLGWTIAVGILPEVFLPSKACMHPLIKYVNSPSAKPGECKHKFLLTPPPLQQANQKGTMKTAGSPWETKCRCLFTSQPWESIPRGPAIFFWVYCESIIKPYRRIHCFFLTAWLMIHVPFKQKISKPKLP